MGDTTTPDAGAGSDAGTATDGGVAAECEGLVPQSPGSAFSFDVLAYDNGETCDSAAIDGLGAVAAAARGASETTWYEFIPNYGARSGNFRAPEIFSQPDGFIGLWGVDPNVSVAWFTEYGEPTLSAPLGSARSVLGPAAGSGVISLTATATALTVRKHDGRAAEVASATLQGAFTPRAVAEDASGAVLAITGAGADWSGFWVDLAKGTAAGPFAILGGTTARLRPLFGGGIALQVDGRWSLVLRPGPVANPVPSWLADAADLVMARGGKAYALLPKSGNAVDVVSVEGHRCGSIAFPGVSSVSVGPDGTVAGGTGPRGCTKFVWRNALR